MLCLYGYQAVIKQFGGTGYESSDVVVIDEIEMQRHQQLEKLYRSTRAGKVEMDFLFIYGFVEIQNYEGVSFVLLINKQQLIGLSFKLG